MRTLVIGGGGREHAICWALRQSPQIEALYCAPGNAGIAELATIVELPDHDLRGLVDFARKERIDLTVVGPERPLAEGIVDEFAREKLRVFGPTASAARLESSKVFAKEFMRRHYIPTTPYRAFDRSDEALKFVAESSGPLVVKADGLAAGKGVIVCRNSDEAHLAVKKIMVERAFGSAGERIIVERLLIGEEMSVMAFADGTHVVPMIPARDYKRAQDGDEGPNTGGMGAYAPARSMEDDLFQEIYDHILEPAVRGMKTEGSPFVGILYAGLMLTDVGPRVLEFNVRFGDPETQVVLPLLKTDLVNVIGAALAGQLDWEPLSWREDVCAGVILTARGYPGRYEGGVPIEGEVRTMNNGVFCFHAGTARDGAGGLASSGGRILGLFARSATHEGAVAAAYAAVERVRIKGAQYRTDIGLRVRRVVRQRREGVARIT
ncbi:MAG: phosphoribosylamine--glycine ligase [candidate division Zixibacteria bacterium]|nr:phosphoribosylamine--glycine ligase [candidate division Zixibacteria bacterium]